MKTQTLENKITKVAMYLIGSVAVIGLLLFVIQVASGNLHNTSNI